MLRHFSADYIIPATGEPVKDGIVSVDSRGEIVHLHDNESARLITDPVERHEGIIVPGFINSHCHLELSHLLHQIPEGKGLIPFISSVITQRHQDENLVLDAMERADKAMHENGIVAVGDISNTNLTKNVKQKSPIYYHTFVELVGFDPKKADEVFNRGLELRKEFAPLPASLTPHAPYSVSKDLFRLLRRYCDGNENLLCIHNQESDDENKLYRYKSGGFIEFYKNLKLDIGFFKAQARNSVQSIVPLFSKRQRILLVHNTYTSSKDIYFVRRFNRDIHWCFCPNANLYIESKLPKIEMFLFHDFNITMGTDSLASNDKLCILSELKTIHEHFPSLPLTQTIKWATLNGAKFLGIDTDFGSIEKGKTPGLNLITDTKGLELTTRSGVKKLI